MLSHVRHPTPLPALTLSGSTQSSPFIAYGEPIDCQLGDADLYFNVVQAPYDRIDEDVPIVDVILPPRILPPGGDLSASFLAAAATASGCVPTIPADCHYDGCSIILSEGSSTAEDDEDPCSLLPPNRAWVTAVERGASMPSLSDEDAGLSGPTCSAYTMLSDIPCPDGSHFGSDRSKEVEERVGCTASGCYADPTVWIDAVLAASGNDANLAQ